MNIRKRWIDHLKKNNMTYTGHMVFALFYGTCCLLAGFYLIVHSILPCFFPTAGSDIVTKLSKRFGRNEAEK